MDIFGFGHEISQFLLVGVRIVADETEFRA
jgi:hypothetical protein